MVTARDSVAPARRDLHVVQVGSDEALMGGDTAVEPVQRQLRYARLLNARRPGSRLTIVTMTAHSSATQYVLENLHVIPVPVRNHGVAKVCGWLRVVSCLRAEHRQWPIGVIATQTVHDVAWALLLFGRAYGIPVVGQIHYDIFDPFAQADLSRSAAVARVRFAITRLALPHFAAVRAVGQGTAEELRRRKLCRQVHVLPVAVAMLESVEPSPPMAERPPRVLFVGRLCAAKNLEGWLDVAARVSRIESAAQFEIIGDGALLEGLEDRARVLGLSGRIRFLGSRPYAELPAHYGAARVFLLTSHYEGFGRVAVEAYANGTPVVASRITGVEDIVCHGESGFLHLTSDVEGMATSVVRLLRDPALATRLARTGIAHARTHFDPQRLASAWVDLLISSAAS